MLINLDLLAPSPCLLSRVMICLHSHVSRHSCPASLPLSHTPWLFSLERKHSSASQSPSDGTWVPGRYGSLCKNQTLINIRSLRSPNGMNTKYWTLKLGLSSQEHDQPTNRQTSRPHCNSFSWHVLVTKGNKSNDYYRLCNFAGCFPYITSA